MTSPDDPILKRTGAPLGERSATLAPRTALPEPANGLRHPVTILARRGTAGGYWRGCLTAAKKSRKRRLLNADMAFGGAMALFAGRVADNEHQ